MSTSDRTRRNRLGHAMLMATTHCRVARNASHDKRFRRFFHRKGRRMGMRPRINSGTMFADKAREVASSALPRRKCVSPQRIASLNCSPPPATGGATATRGLRSGLGASPRASAQQPAGAVCLAARALGHAPTPSLRPSAERSAHAPARVLARRCAAPPVAALHTAAARPHACARPLPRTVTSSRRPWWVGANMAAALPRS